MRFESEKKNTQLDESIENNDNPIHSRPLTEAEDHSEDYDDCFRMEATEDKLIEADKEGEDDFADCGKDDVNISNHQINENTEDKITENKIREEKNTEDEITEDEITEDEIAEKDITESETAEPYVTFDDVMSYERGTDEYRAALEAYNRQEQKKEKSQELHEVQLSKSKEAVAASNITLMTARELQDRYNESYYSNKPDYKSFSELRIQNISTMEDMTAQRNSVKLGMDAKMTEIYEYVAGNNMNYFDTSRDPQYQKLTEEYLAMKSVEDRLKSSIAALDANNINLSEITQEEYVSVHDIKKGTMIKEVASGTDYPGGTDYFLDETRAAEVLTPFRQSEWEKLPFLEQKDAIEELADYNAEILDINRKPTIEYYHIEDEQQFGGYSAEQNAIYINTYNMHNAAETADTISHEYRHCYQHERAEKLENERDLTFREEFNDYISPENDYAGYRKQLIEADARSYAEAIQDKIRELDDNPEIPANRVTDSTPMESDYGSINPEEEADLPSDFTDKNVEKRSLDKVFEIDELCEIKAKVQSYYQNNIEIAKRISWFDRVKEHHDVESGHIEKVRVKSLEAADLLAAHFNENSYGDIYSPDIDRRTIEVMALYHDTGMDGNINAGEFDEANQRFLSKGGTQPEFETQFRKKHAIQSAIHALRDRSFIEDKSVNADEVALGCLLHSKSTSGVSNLADESQWHSAFDQLRAAVNEYNAEHPEEPPIYFNASFVQKENGDFNQQELAKLRSECLCVRLGDAEGHDYKSMVSQNGKLIQFSLDDGLKIEANDLVEKTGNFEVTEYQYFFNEIQHAKVFVDGEELTNDSDKEGISRAYASGEGNFLDTSLQCINGKLCQVIELVNGDAFPRATQYCINQRLEELNTANLKSDEIPEKPIGMSVKCYQKEFIPAQLSQMPKIDITVIVSMRNASEQTQKAYGSFVDAMKKKYNISLEVRNENMGA